MLTKVGLWGLLPVSWLALVGLETFALTLAFLGVGFLWGRRSVERVDRADRLRELQIELRHIERDHEHETRHLSEWYRTECERALHDQPW